MTTAENWTEWPVNRWLGFEATPKDTEDQKYDQKIIGAVVGITDVIPSIFVLIEVKKREYIWPKG